MTREEFEHETELLQAMVKAYELRLNDEWFNNNVARLKLMLVNITRELDDEHKKRSSADQVIANHKARIDALAKQYEQDKVARAEQATASRSSKPRELTTLQKLAADKLRLLGSFTEDEILAMVRVI